MHPRAIAVVCDLGYIRGGQALINSIQVYHPELPIFVFERGFRAEEFAWMAGQPARIQVSSVSRFPYYCPGLWEAKQQVLAECLGRVRHLCLIDADVVLLSRIDDVFEASEQGRIAAGCDLWHIQFGEEYQSYGSTVVGQTTIGINSGLFCLDLQRHWDLVGLWAFSSNYGAYSPHKGYPLALAGFGDQGLLNALIVRLGKQADCHILPHGVWHDFRQKTTLRISSREPGGALVVQNCELGQRQRINHCVGYKWWQEEARQQHEHGDKLECFFHFARLNFTGKKPETAPEVVPAEA